MHLFTKATRSLRMIFKLSEYVLWWRFILYNIKMKIRSEKITGVAVSELQLFRGFSRGISYLCTLIFINSLNTCTCLALISSNLLYLSYDLWCVSSFYDWWVDRQMEIVLPNQMLLHSTDFTIFTNFRFQSWQFFWYWIFI